MPDASRNGDGRYQFLSPLPPLGGIFFYWREGLVAGLLEPYVKIAATRISESGRKMNRQANG
jgi:hypothetical protein